MRVLQSCHRDKSTKIHLPEFTAIARALLGKVRIGGSDVLQNFFLLYDYWTMYGSQRWNRSGFSRPDPTGKFQNHRRLTGRSTGFWLARSTVFFTEWVCSLFNVSNEKFSKAGGHGWGVKICDFGRGSQKKMQKNFCVFCKNDSILRPFLVKFRFEWPVLSSAKRAQNKHKKHWRAQAKLLDVLSNDILQKAKK